MKVKWFIEDYNHDSSLKPLMDEIENQGMDCLHFKWETWNNPKPLFSEFSDDECVIFYGTLNLGREIQKSVPWIPGVYCNFKNLCCHTYYSYWAKYLLNQDYMMIPMLEILRNRDYIYNNYGDLKENIFIRPDSGAKPITGQLLNYNELDKEFKLFRDYAGNDLDQIISIVSSAKQIEIEWRFVVVNKKVVAGSQYKKDEKLDINPFFDVEAFELADKIAKEEWQPDKVYTLDICKSYGKYYLLEANSFSCSGLYEADPTAIVREVSKVALEEWKEYNDGN